MVCQRHSRMAYGEMGLFRSASEFSDERFAGEWLSYQVRWFSSSVASCRIINTYYRIITLCPAYEEGL